MINVSSILPWLSLAVGLIAIYGFYTQRKKATMADGKREGEFEQLRKDVDHAIERVRALEDSNRCTEIDMTEIKTDLRHVLVALERIENRLAGTRNE